MYQSGHIAKKSAQNFLKAVYALQGKHDLVRTGALASALKLRASAITSMAICLSSDGLISYQKYHGVKLTETGELLVREINYRHQLLVQFLTSNLGYTPETANEDAEQLEQAMSDRFVHALEQRVILSCSTE